jgi:hypothetical protein
MPGRGAAVEVVLGGPFAEVRGEGDTTMGGLLMLAYSGPGKWALGQRANS